MTHLCKFWKSQMEVLPLWWQGCHCWLHFGCTQTQSLPSTAPSEERSRRSQGKCRQRWSVSMACKKSSDNSQSNYSDISQSNYSDILKISPAVRGAQCGAGPLLGGVRAAALFDGKVRRVGWSGCTWLRTRGCRMLPWTGASLFERPTESSQTNQSEAEAEAPHRAPGAGPTAG